MIIFSVITMIIIITILITMIIMIILLIIIMKITIIIIGLVERIPLQVHARNTTALQHTTID